MKPVVFVLALASSLSVGCAKITVPVSGTLSDGSAVTGQATAEINGDGTFYVDVGQTRCSGVYNSMDPAKHITIPVTCGDGRTGTVEVTRVGLGTSGTATVAMNDGTTGNFVFGK